MLDATALIGLAGVVLGGLISSGTTWLMARSERMKFAREKLWDVRREAYMNVIGSLVQAKRLAKHMADQYDDDPHRYDASDELRRALTQFVDAFGAAQAAFVTNQLMLSTNFIDRFETLLHEVGDVNQNDNLLPPERARLAPGMASDASHSH